jgi:argininosuccinate lyase
MKVWDKRFASRNELPLLEAFNASIEEDRFLYRAEIEASTAYARVLHKASILSSDELKRMASGLVRVRERIESGEDLGRFEDIHSAVEILLTEEIGEAGKKLHTGRSRNEQVVTDERLYVKEKIPQLIDRVREIQRAVIRLAEENPDIVMPGFTHLQQAECVLFSHYIMSLFWPLDRTQSRLREVLRRIDKLPLGVGALAGSTVAINREYLGEILGFGSITENSMDSVADRSFILEVLFVLTLVLLDIGRFAEDFVVFSSQEFGYLDLDDSIVTSSSLMPQKKNPDFFELMRAGSARLFGHLTHLFVTVKGLPSTYNKDLQEDKGPLRQGVEETIRMLEVFNCILVRIKPNRKRILERMNSFLFSTDLVDYLVRKGVPFREAHGIVGGLVSDAENKNEQIHTLSLGELQRHSPCIGPDVFEIFDPMHSVRQKKTAGSTHPDWVKVQIERAKNLIP